MSARGDWKLLKMNFISADLERRNKSEVKVKQIAQEYILTTAFNRPFLTR